jgi:hypothetical protein
MIGPQNLNQCLKLGNGKGALSDRMWVLAVANWRKKFCHHLPFLTWAGHLKIGRCNNWRQSRFSMFDEPF